MPSARGSSAAPPTTTSPIRLCKRCGRQCHDQSRFAAPLCTGLQSNSVERRKETGGGESALVCVCARRGSILASGSPLGRGDATPLFSVVLHCATGGVAVCIRILCQVPKLSEVPKLSTRRSATHIMSQNVHRFKWPRPAFRTKFSLSWPARVPRRLVFVRVLLRALVA